MVLRPIPYILHTILVSCEWTYSVCEGKKEVFLPHSHPGACVGGNVSAWLGVGTGILLPRCFGLRHCQVFDDPDKTIEEVSALPLDALKATQGAHVSAQ